MINEKFFNIPVIYFFIVATILFDHIPVIGKFFRVLNTAVHELGHAAVSLILRGEVRKIELFHNTEGMATTANSNKFKTVIVSLSGYIFASSASLLSFFVIYKEWYFQQILSFIIIFLIMLILWIRNFYGILWVIIFSSINIFFLYFYKNEEVIKILSTAYTTILFTESLYSSFIIFFLSIKKPKDAGDATILAKTTKIPAFFWGLIFLGFSLYVTYVVIIKFGFFKIIN